MRLTTDLICSTERRHSRFIENSLDGFRTESEKRSLHSSILLPRTCGTSVKTPSKRGPLFDPTASWLHPIASLVSDANSVGRASIFVFLWQSKSLSLFGQHYMGERHARIHKRTSRAQSPQRTRKQSRAHAHAKMRACTRRHTRPRYPCDRFVPRVQNCHLLPKWLKTFEKLVEKSDEKPHEHVQVHLQK